MLIVQTVTPCNIWSTGVLTNTETIIFWHTRTSVARIKFEKFSLTIKISSKKMVKKQFTEVFKGKFSFNPKNVILF